MNDKMLKEYNQRKFSESGYYALAAAIVETSCRDYIMARRAVFKAKNQKKRDSAAADVNALLRFFRSKWYGTLCDIDPDTLIAMLDEEADNGLKSYWTPSK